MASDPFLGEIQIFAFNFPPRGYALCAGQLLAINQNSALFALLGTIYGGNGTSTFALPDLRGRVAKGYGQGPGLYNYYIGEAAGTTSVTLNIANLPAHVHGVQGIVAKLPVATGPGDTTSPNGNYLAQATADMYATAPTAGKNYGAAAVSGTTAIAGSSIPIDVQNPYLVINYSIALQGVFPSRN